MKENKVVLPIQDWIQTGREKYHAGKLSDQDFDRLERLIETKKQKVIYLYSKSTSMRSQMFRAGLVYDPNNQDEPELSSQESPYESVMSAVRDGWRIVQFPISKLYSCPDVDNDYLGYEFVLEKIGQGKSESPESLIR